MDLFYIENSTSMFPFLIIISFTRYEDQIYADMCYAFSLVAMKIPHKIKAPPINALAVGTSPNVIQASVIEPIGSAKTLKATYYSSIS